MSENKNVKKIGYRAFSGCKGLIKLTISDGVEEIGESSFYGCYHLTSVTLPQSIKLIETDAFGQCLRLVEICNKSNLNITIGGKDNGAIGYFAKNVYASSEDSKLFIDENGFVKYKDGDVVSLIDYVGTETQLVLPDDITEIASLAFWNNKEIIAVVAGNNVTRIGVSVFDGCSALEKVELPDNIQKIAPSVCDSDQSDEFDEYDSCFDVDKDGNIIFDENDASD